MQVPLKCREGSLGVLRTAISLLLTKGTHLQADFLCLLCLKATLQFSNHTQKPNLKAPVVKWFTGEPSILLPERGAISCGNH